MDIGVETAFRCRLHVQTSRLPADERRRHRESSMPVRSCGFCCSSPNELAERVNAIACLTAFAGTTRVGQMFARLGYRDSNECRSSRVFALCYFCGEQAAEELMKKSFDISMNLRHTTVGLPKIMAGSWPTRQASVANFTTHESPHAILADEIDRLGLRRSFSKSVLLTSLIPAPRRGRFDDRPSRRILEESVKEIPQHDVWFQSSADFRIRS
ncbi:MAG: hypothetical protein IPJ30_24115 [Acidobacteria bacterium]|nr:hypothetical protein [Acidobacteriota bacterium]